VRVLILSTGRYMTLTKFSKQRFAEVYHVIEAISLKYFSNIDGEVKPIFAFAKHNHFTYCISGPGKGTRGAGDQRCLFCVCSSGRYGRFM
jgi:hypothetical protein